MYEQMDQGIRGQAVRHLCPQESLFVLTEATKKIYIIYFMYQVQY